MAVVFFFLIQMQWSGTLYPGNHKETAGHGDDNQCTRLASVIEARTTHARLLIQQSGKIESTIVQLNISFALSKYC